MIFQILILSILAILTAFVAGNNLSATVGTIIGSRVVSKIFGILIGISGLIAGFLIEGKFLSNSLSKILPETNYNIVVVLTVSTLMFFIAAYVRVPLSLVMALIGTSLGVALRTGYKFQEPYLLLVILAWIVSPVFSIILSYYLNTKLGDAGTVNVWKSARFYKLSLIILSFVTSFTLGANTFGLLGSFDPHSMFTSPIMVVAIIFGAMVLSKGVLKRVGQDLYAMRYRNALVSLLVSSLLVEGATFIGVPIPSTQAMTSSVFGTGLSYTTKVISFKPFLVVVLMWIVSPLLGLLLGFTFA